MSAAPLDRPEVVAAAERYLHQPRPLFTKLPVPYRIVPLGIRTRLLRLMASPQREEGFPAWPIERSLDQGVTFPAYEGRRAAVVITHDIDTAPELGAIAQIRDWERDLGLVASFGFVPRVSWPTEDAARSLVAEQCEVYVHDLGHDGRLPYQTRDAMRDAFRELFDRSPWAADTMRTFRSGQLLCSPALMDVVAERFAIDMSIPDTERNGPYGGQAGAGSVFPFRLRGLLEIPVTMPQEVFLRQVYGLSAEDTLGVWRTKLTYIKELGGVASLNIHPVWLERDPGLKRVVRELFVELARDDSLLVTTPSRLADLLSAN